jgi:hypothetical protein
VQAVLLMSLVNLVETLERFFKETAAERVDCLSDLIMDDRFSVFTIQGTALASHFGAGTLGKSLCEAETRPGGLLGLSADGLEEDAVFVSAYRARGGSDARSPRVPVGGAFVHAGDAQHLLFLERGT